MLPHINPYVVIADAKTRRDAAAVACGEILNDLRVASTSVAA